MFTGDRFGEPDWHARQDVGLHAFCPPPASQPREARQGEWMGFDHWLVALWDREVKEREFVLEFWDSSVAIGSKGSFRTNEPMSEEKLREELAKMGVPNERADAEIVKARKGR